ncbi:MAG: NUDIX hydrolase [Clostridia bacterium]|nr:NUDIX hydrolase [Clostridia bacterium]
MSEYIKTIRKKVGHDPVLQCGASVILINESGEILLQLRKDNGKWGYHGGSVELNEVVECAAARELFEETGLRANSLELFGVFSGEDMAYTYPNGDVVSNVDIVFICRDYSGTLIPQAEEVSELRFFPLNDLPENIFDANIPALKKLVETYSDNE